MYKVEWTVRREGVRVGGGWVSLENGMKGRMCLVGDDGTMGACLKGR
jgi:hypothetical protein